MELTHTLFQSFVFLREVSAADLQFFCRWAVARKRTVVCQGMTDAWSDDSAEQRALGDKYARGHLQCCTAMCHHLRNVHLSPHHCADGFNCSMRVITSRAELGSIQLWDELRLELESAAGFFPSGYFFCYPDTAQRERMRVADRDR